MNTSRSSSALAPMMMSRPSTRMRGARPASTSAAEVRATCRDRARNRCRSGAARRVGDRRAARRRSAVLAADVSSAVTYSRTKPSGASGTSIETAPACSESSGIGALTVARPSAPLGCWNVASQTLPRAPASAAAKARSFSGVEFGAEVDVEHDPPRAQRDQPIDAVCRAARAATARRRLRSGFCESISTVAMRPLTGPGARAKRGSVRKRSSGAKAPSASAATTSSASTEVARQEPPGSAASAAQLVWCARAQASLHRRRATRLHAAG